MVGVEHLAEAFHGGLVVLWRQVMVLDRHEGIRNSRRIGVLPRNPTADLNIAVIVGFYGDVVLVEAWKLAIELVGILVLLEVEAWNELMAQVAAGAGEQVLGILFKEAETRDEVVVSRPESRDDFGARHSCRVDDEIGKREWIYVMRRLWRWMFR